MRINRTKLFHGALFLASVFLTACGGGGGVGGTTSATTYTIGGTVTSLNGSGLVLQNNGGGNLSISADGSFVFAAQQANSTTYQVTVLTQPSGQTCTVSSSSGTVSAANVTNVAVTCASSTNTHTIGGTVSGLNGTGLVLQNNGGDNLSISANGSFAFASSQTTGASYQVTVLTQPSGQTCTVSSASGVVAANVTSVAVACSASATTYTIGGNVTSLTGTGLVLQNNGGGNLPITSNGSFVFAATQANFSVYQVTVLTQPTGQTCTVTPIGGVVSSANVTTVTVTCAANTYSIGGTISGLTTAGLVLQNNGGDSLTVSSGATAFTFITQIASGAVYNVTVQTQPTGQICTVNSPSGTVSTANVATVSVACSTNTYSIGGTVTGLTGSGLVLQNNGGDDLAAASGGYTFTTVLADGSAYNVTVLTQPTAPAQICTVNASGTIASANVTNADVTCVNSYTIGGTITGAVAGIGPILQNNLGDNLFIPAITTGSTAFTFSTPVADGASYSVAQITRARSPSQDCSSITAGSGNVSGGNVTVSITCVLSPIVPKFAYVTNSTFNTTSGAADTVSAFTINDATGALAAATTPTTASGDGPYAVSVGPTGQFAYVVNSNADSVTVYSIDSVTGVLTAVDADGASVGNQASIATGDNPKSIAVHPSGKFAYVANQGNGSSTGNTLSAYSINLASGALTAIDADSATNYQATIATGTFPYAVTIDPLGKFAYVANDASNNVSAYTIDQITGELTVVAGSPFAAGTNPRSIAIDPAGKYAFAANAGGDISAYSIGGAGALTQIACAASGLTACTGNNYTAGSAPRSIAVDPNSGLYAYVANAGGGVSAFAINPATGTLAAIDADAVTAGDNLTIAAGSVPFSINVEPSGQFVYVANFGSSSVSVYSIGGGGALTLLQTALTGSGPTSVVTTQ